VEEDRHQHARLRQDQLAAQGGRQLGVSGRRLAAALVAAAGLGCASATNYLDPKAPVYSYAREAAAAAAPAASAPLRVVSFNIEYGIEIERALAVLRGTAALRDPDLLSLQEMDAPGTERIAKALRMNALYFPSGVHPKHHRDFGCALLSPWPLVEPRKLVLPHGARGSGLRRSVTIATLVRGEERVRVYSVHLPSPLAISGGSRLDELRVLAEDAARSPDPVVIAGDFNSHDKVAELERRGFDWLTRKLGDTTRLELFGLPLAHMSYDHVLVKGLRLADGPDALGIVRDNKGASDHLPIWAVLVAAP
jgi:endonuclease/exonuclease/phosphatase family metal-dependent hydrolase